MVPRSRSFKGQGQQITGSCIKKKHFWVGPNCETNHSANSNQAQICSWSQPVLSNEGKEMVEQLW